MSDDEHKDETGVTGGILGIVGGVFLVSILLVVVWDLALMIIRLFPAAFE